MMTVRVGRVFTAKRAERGDAFSVRRGTSVTAPAPFGSPAMAARALAHEETAYWQQLLAAFAAAIEAEWYTFGTDARAQVALPHDTRAMAGAAIVKARSRHLSPQRSEGDLEDMLLQAARDGYAGSWADWCQRGAEAAGWYVIRREVSQSSDNTTDK
ncbi:hypothetical protein F3J38_26285 [Pantoea sp. Acro-805]|uniref:Uncharacterized protein n=1 Tax=Candidatus Pantoea formicae TaxID=2608355 RepID=A0ABX0R2Q3_9GAMM|nr:hypothetical protein [Pantoea formicae]NIF03514.1 hypothetical protein [Pantoea formicae]